MRPRKFIDKYYFPLILLVFGLLLSLILYETYRPFEPVASPGKEKEITQAPKKEVDSLAPPMLPKDSIAEAPEEDIAR